MGLAKRYMEEVDAQGWYPTGKWVCERCIDEPFLASKVKEESEDDNCCSFCDESPAAELDTLIEAFMNGITLRYEDADNEHRYDSEAGEYLGNAVDTWDLITWEYGHIFSGPGLLEAVRDSIINKTWQDNYYWYNSPSEALGAGWACGPNQGTLSYF